MKERYKQTFEKIKISQEAHERILAKVKGLENSLILTSEIKKESKSFWTRKKFTFSFSGVLLILLSVLLITLIKSADSSNSPIIKGGDWQINSGAPVEGIFLSYEIEEKASLKNEKINFNLYLGHGGLEAHLKPYLQKMNEKVFENPEPLTDEDFDSLIFTIDLVELTQASSGNSMVYQYSTLVEDLISIHNYYSDEFKISTIYEDGVWTSISYPQKFSSSLATALLNKDESTLEFRLMVEFPTLNKKAPIKNCLLNYNKSFNDIEFSF